MLFNSSSFAVFFAVTLVVYWALPTLRSRNLFLLGASYLFYGWWDWRFLSLLIGSSTIDYWAGVKMQDTSDARRRTLLLWMSCGTNVGMLVVFKYFNFFAENVRVAFEVAGLHLSWPVLHVILPIGMSFYTLQAMSYTIDVYRRTTPACRDYPDFLLFVAYFPPLIAGPISRARDLLPQIQTLRRFDAAMASEAIPYLAIGYVLKTVVADNLSTAVSATLANVSAHSGLELLAATYCTLYEVYADFAGYAYIAVGISLLFGIRLPQNFRSPLLSQSIRELWTRWNMSVTMWFRDYVFFTSLGRRPSRTRIRATIVFAFLVSGLWHIASWMSIVWGLLNGIEYLLPPALPGRRAVGKILNTFICLNLAAANWLLFRVRRGGDVLIIAHRIAMNFWPVPSAGEPGVGDIARIYGWRIAVVVCALAFEFAQRNVMDLPQINRWPVRARYAFYAGLAVLYFYRGNFSRIPFIYFQF